jgi:ribosomal protein L15E
MGLYQYIKQTFQQEYKNKDENYKNRLIKWRKEPSIVKIEKP